MNKISQEISSRLYFPKQIFMKKAFAIALLALLLFASFLGLRFAHATSNGFNLYAQNTLAQGQAIDLTGTVCPTPGQTYYTVDVNYTSPSGANQSYSLSTQYYNGDLCSSQFTIDTTTSFTTLGTWTAQAIFYSDTGSSTSNVISFTVSSAVSTTTSSSPSSSSFSSASGSSTTTSSATSSSCNGFSGVCGTTFPGSTSGTQNVTLSPGSTAEVSVNITAPSYLGYFAVSQSLVQEAVVSREQYSAFQNYPASFCDGSAASYSASCGSSILNGLLILPGSYYLIVYLPQGGAQQSSVYFGFDASLQLQVVNATSYVGAFINVTQTGGQVDFVLHDLTVGSPTTFTLFGISTEAVSYSLLDLTTSKSVFSSPAVTTSNLNGTMPSTAIEPFYTVDLQAGVYALFIHNNSPDQAEVYFEYNITTQYINPYIDALSSRAGLFDYPTAPMGVTSFGVYNQSNSISPYPEPVETSSLAGSTLINAISTGSTISTNDASNQLNGILVVNNTDGTQDVYWPQNAMVFETFDHVVAMWDDVFNMTGDGATLTNATITSPMGDFASGGYFGIQNQPSYFDNGWLNYSLPLSYVMVMNEQVLPGTGVVVNMSVDVLAGMKQTGLVTFDTITIHDPSIQTAYFFVSGTQYTPVGIAGFMVTFYDAENVFGGGGGGSTGNFTAFSAMVKIAYYSDQNQNYTIFPSAYTFGADTGETAANLHATYKGSGVVSLGLGSDNLDYAYALSGTSGPGGPNSPTTTPNPTLTQQVEAVVSLLAIVAAVVVVFFIRRQRRALTK